MAARDEVDRNRSSYPPMFSANCRPGMARESEGRRRHLDYGEAQSFQDLPLCRFLRLIGDELDAGLAGSSGISVEDFQTHPHDPWVLAPIEHAGKIRSRIASETTYGRSAEATASRTWAPAGAGWSQRGKSRLGGPRKYLFLDRSSQGRGRSDLDALLPFADPKVLALLDQFEKAVYAALA